MIYNGKPLMWMHTALRYLASFVVFDRRIANIQGLRLDFLVRIDDILPVVRAFKRIDEIIINSNKKEKTAVFSTLDFLQNRIY